MSSIITNTNVALSSAGTSSAPVPDHDHHAEENENDLVSSASAGVEEENDEKQVKVDDHVDVNSIQQEDEVEESKQKQHSEHSNGRSSSQSSSSSSSSTPATSSTAGLVSEMKSIRVGKDSSGSEFYDVRIAVVGNVDSGKSTLIGVLTGGQLDNGRGSARARVFVHAHESVTGRTSCISQHIMGFDHENHPVHQTIPASASSAQKTKSWQQVVSASRNVITFIDLAGHEKYLKTTIAGLTGLYADFAFVIVNSLAGITKMTKEHLGVVIALDIPLVVIVTKVDLVPSTVLERTKTQLDKILKSPAAKKLPLTVRTEGDVDTCINNVSARMCPLFFISAVQGTNLDLLYSYMAKLKPRVGWLQDLEKPSEFSIDDTFNVSGVGVVASGTVRHGFIRANQQLLLGPIAEGSGSRWMPVLVRSVHCKRIAVESVHAGNSCALSLRSVSRKDELKRQTIRRGMVLVAPELNPEGSRFFESEVLILHHPSTIKRGYQAVIHAGIIRQTACIINISRECLRSGDRGNVRFKFLMRDEYLHVGTTFVFREGSTKGLGKITKVHFTNKEIEEFEEDERRRKLQHKQQKLTHTQPSSEVSETEVQTTTEQPQPADGSANARSLASSSSSSSTFSSSSSLPSDASVGAILAPSTGKVDDITGALDDKRAKAKYQNRRAGQKDEKEREVAAASSKAEKDDTYTVGGKKGNAQKPSSFSSSASSHSSTSHSSSSAGKEKDKGKDNVKTASDKTVDESGKKKGGKR